jgi:hypothetical protein
VKFSLFLTGVLFLSLNLFSESAYRNPNFDYNQYLKSSSSLRLQGSSTAVGSKAALSTIDFSVLPDYKSFEVAMGVFQQIRDVQFLNDPDFSNVLRRSSWLYPQDGCFARAQLVVNNIDHMGLANPKKLFIFGNLKVNTDYSSKGYVTWWYHVVPTVRVGQHVLVFDPAIEPKHPLFLTDWIRLQNIDLSNLELNAEFSLCNSSTYSPSSNCKAGDPIAEKMALKAQKRFLRYERQNLQTLNLPESYLFDKAPWF